MTKPSPGHSYVIIGGKGGIKHDGATERAIEHDGYGSVGVDSKQSFVAKNLTSHFIRLYL